MRHSDTQLIPLEAIEHRIHVVRGLKVMLDKDLAELYQVPTKRLNEQVKRNVDRFPLDFMFQLNEEEASILRSQNATSKPGSGGRRYLPYVFTEHGALMLASVLTSTNRGGCEHSNCASSCATARTHCEPQKSWRASWRR